MKISSSYSHLLYPGRSGIHDTSIHGGQHKVFQVYVWEESKLQFIATESGYR